MTALRATALVLCCMLTACTAAPSASPPTSVVGAGPGLTHIVISTTATANNLPEWLAKESGIFAKHGLDAEFQTLTDENAVAALITGGVNFSPTGASQAVLASSAGADLAILAVKVPTFPWKFYARPEINTLADLKGKKVGITAAGAPFDVGLRMVLPRLGLQPDRDVTFIAAGSIPNVTAALFSGALDGTALVVGPDSLKAESLGMRVLFDFADQKVSYPLSGITIQRAYLTANRSTVQEYVDSIVEAITLVKRDKPATVEVIKKYIGSTDPVEIDYTYNYFSRILLSQPLPKAELFADMVASLAETNEQVRGLDITRLIDASFVESAVSRGLDT
jgi:ABC-type nitrate/sulfonate/bicarbonate transport system substrate-binding protein